MKIDIEIMINIKVIITIQAELPGINLNVIKNNDSNNI